MCLPVLSCVVPQPVSSAAVSLPLVSVVSSSPPYHVYVAHVPPIIIYHKCQKFLNHQNIYLNFEQISLTEAKCLTEWQTLQCSSNRVHTVFSGICVHRNGNTMIIRNLSWLFGANIICQTSAMMYSSGRKQ